MKCIWRVHRFFCLAHVPCANMEGAVLMTYTAASHQGGINMFWLHFYSYFYSLDGLMLSGDEDLLREYPGKCQQQKNSWLSVWIKCFLCQELTWQRSFHILFKSPTLFRERKNIFLSSLAQLRKRYGIFFCRFHSAFPTRYFNLCIRERKRVYCHPATHTDHPGVTLISD